MGGLFRALNRTKVFRNLTEHLVQESGDRYGAGEDQFGSGDGVLFDCDRDRDSRRSADRSGLRRAGGS